VGRPASPLRYPGGKSCLLDMTADILRMNGLERGHYAEPYAGGCGLALSLLYGGHVADIHINDIDPAVWAFWHCVLNETAGLLKLIESTPVTVEQWLKQRDIQRNPGSTGTLELGFSTFFLNRTNRSGIIKAAGVIGGLEQKGQYKIDCRFNRDELTRRIARIKRYEDQIHLTNLDAVKFLGTAQAILPENSLLFIDPPYFKKGSELYTSFYEAEDHALLSTKIGSIAHPWVVTYDDNSEIRRLYKDRRQYCFNLQYSVHEKRIGTELLIASKGLKLPSAVREWQVNKPQHRAAA
jgi:DNA adenine methylase